ncbi:MAG: helix-turn-helix domain-containing protein [Chloroflexota bacterium]
MPDYISLKSAAEIIGVHPSTVRLWTDKGILPAHRTPGGHRRYKRADVELWAEHSRRGGIQPEVIMQSAVRNVRMRIAEGRLEAERWYQKLDNDARNQYRQSAHTLFQGLMSFISANGGDVSSESHAIGFEYASRARRYKLSYVEAAQAFLFFRNTLIESVVVAYREANIPFDEMLHRMHAFTDDILVSLLQTYQTLEKGKT